MSATPHIFLFYGQDSYTIKEHLARQSALFTQKYHKGSIVILQGDPKDSTLTEQLKNSLRNQSLFSSSSLVILKGLLPPPVRTKKEDEEENREEGHDTHTDTEDPDTSKISTNTPIKDLLPALLPHIPATTFLIIQEDTVDTRTVWYKTLLELQKKGEAVIKEFATPTGDTLRHWITEQIKKKGGTITPEGLMQLAKRFAPQDTGKPQGYGKKKEEGLSSKSLWQLHHEIEKCIAYTQGRAITAEDIRTMIPEDPQEVAIFDLIDAIITGQTLHALTCANLLIAQGGREEKSAIIPLISVMHGQLREYIAFKSLQEQGTRESEIAEKLGWSNPKRVFPVSKKLAGVSSMRLIHIAEQLIALDYALKTGLQSPHVQLDRTIIALTKKSAD